MTTTEKRGSGEEEAGHQMQQQAKKGGEKKKERGCTLHQHDVTRKCHDTEMLERPTGGWLQ